ncbi:U1 small nuclear ribonucleoprotein 70 kDa [Oryza glaberrima]|uniref:RRM domain-containing protein n=1 Tax=Oryza glaberrima TaxID=4538 RepID=I1QS83_ORYGL|nr:U1 small nuclear ribonucleoprotein 70 kDa [Oryza glaberrima]
MGDYGSGMMRGNPDGGGMQSRTKGQRVNVQQLKLMGQGHPTGLTPNLLKLFEPRPPLDFKPPVEKRKLPAYTGMAQFVSQFAEPGDPEYAPPVPMCETKAEKKDRIRKSKLDQGAAKVAEELQKYDPQSDPNATGDPYKTLFVARLNYETSEHRVKREFEAYGPIKRVRLVTDKETNKPRGYAFIEYMHTRDMKNAYKQADGRKVDNRRVLVDVERGRTVPNWRPRRLGGGLGSSRIGGENAEQKLSTRDQQHAGRPRSEEPRRDERRADRDREKSRERPRERDRDERTRERSHDRTRERDSKEDRHHHRDRDRTRDRERGRDRERDHGRDRDRDRERDRRDRDRDRDRGRDYERDRDRGHDRHRERGRDRERDYERASHERDRGHVHERDAEYANGEPKHDRNLAGYDQEYGYNYEQHKSHDAYETERSKRHEHEYYQMQPNNTEPEGPEEGEAYDEGDYQYHQAADEHNN